MAKKHKIILYVFIVISLTVSYLVYGRNEFLAYLNGGKNDFFTFILTHFYPRFILEKSRFPTEFYLLKIDQFLLRILFAISIVFVLSFKSTFDFLLNKDVSTSKMQGKVLHIIYFSFLFYITFDWWILYTKLDEISIFYSPLKIISFLPYPHLVVVKTLLVIMWLSALLNFFYTKWGIKLATMLIFSYLQALFFSFNKIDHGYLLFTYVGYLFIFWNQNEKWNGKLMGAIQLTICLAYTFAGLEKLFSSGFTWAEASNFKTFLLLHPNDVSIWLSKNYLLCLLLPLFAFLFQITFLLAFFNQKLRQFYLIIGILFHVGTFYIFNIGAIFHPWLLTYLFFIPSTFFDAINFSKKSHKPE